MGRRVGFRLPGSWGLVLLGVWLVVTGLMGLLHLSFSGLEIIMALLALAAGILILIGM